MSDTVQGAVIAVCGVLVGLLVAAYNNRKEREERKNALFREKCETIADLMTVSAQWYNRLTLCYSFEDLKKCSPPPENMKIGMLAKLYFPALEDIAIDHANLIVTYYHYLLDFATPMAEPMPMSVVARAVGHDKKAYLEWDRKITATKMKLLDGLSEQIKEHL
jgi:hypothetical protein